MKLENIFEDGTVERRRSALGHKYPSSGRLEPVLRQAYVRLFVGLELVLAPEPPRWLSWIAQKLGRPMRQPLGLLLGPDGDDPKITTRLFKIMVDRKPKPPHFYWRTLLITKFVEANRVVPVPVDQLEWLAAADPMLHSFLSAYGEVMDDEDQRALGLHHDVECRAGEALSLMEVLQDLRLEPLRYYLSFPQQLHIKELPLMSQYLPLPWSGPANQVPAPEAGKGIL